MLSPAHLNRRIHLWSRTLTGRFIVLLLLAALDPAIRVVVDHAHAEGSHAHAHFEQLAPDQDEGPDFAEPGEVQLHRSKVAMAGIG